MNKKSKTMIAFILCLALSVSGTVTAFALNSDKGSGSDSKKKSSETSDEDVKDIDAIKNASSDDDETVYVLADASGNVSKVILNDGIKAVDGNGKEIDDNDSIKKELPVEMNVSYKLDGKKISADDILGKSGKVTIRFDYKNNKYENADINGKKEKIYVPFAVMTGMILDDESFSNVETTNARLVNDGDHMAVVGIALPGMQENLGVKKDKADIPDYVEITADVTDFKMGMTLTVATNEVFNEIDSSKLDSADGIKDSINELKDGMDQLMDGSSKLCDGLKTLNDKSGELSNGTKQLTDGANTLRNGADTLASGAGQIQSGAEELSTGLNTLKSNNADLNGGAKQVFETLLSTAETQINAAGLPVSGLSISNYGSVLTELINSLDEKAVYSQALEQVTAAVEKNRQMIVDKVTAAVNEQVQTQVEAAVKQQVSAQVEDTVKTQVSDQVIAASGLGMSSKSDYDAAVAAGLIPQDVQDQIANAIEAQMQTDVIKNTIESNISAQMQSDNIKALIKSNVDSQMQSDAIKQTIADNVEAQVKKAISDNMQSPEVQAKLAQAAEGAKSIIALKTSLDSYNAFYLGLIAYTDGVASASNGADKLAKGAADLKNGTDSLKSGSTALYNGIAELNGQVPKLVDGVSQLTDGASKLSDGLDEFNEKGIQKIVDLAEDDLEDISARLKATVNASKNYHGFTDNKGEDINVKFIYKTDEIE